MLFSKPPHHLDHFDDGSLLQPVLSQAHSANVSRRTHLAILPLFCCICAACYIDRTNLAFASVHLNEDLNFTPEGVGCFAVCNPEHRVHRSIHPSHRIQQGLPSRTSGIYARLEIHDHHAYEVYSILHKVLMQARRVAMRTSTRPILLNLHIRSLLHILCPQHDQLCLAVCACPACARLGICRHEDMLTWLFAE